AFDHYEQIWIELIDGIGASRGGVLPVCPGRSARPDELRGVPIVCGEPCGVVRFIAQIDADDIRLVSEGVEHRVPIIDPLLLATRPPGRYAEAAIRVEVVP